MPEDAEDSLPDGGQINELPEVDEPHSVNIDQADVEPSEPAIVVEEVREEDPVADPSITALAIADEPVEDPNPAEPIQVTEQLSTVDDAIIADTSEQSVSVVEGVIIANDAIPSDTGEAGTTEQSAEEELVPQPEAIDEAEELVVDDVLIPTEEHVTEGPIAEDLTPTLATSEGIEETLVVDDPVISTAVEEPVQESVETIEDHVIASDPEEAAASTSEPSAAVTEEPAAEEFATDDVAVEPPVDDPLLPVTAENQVEHPVEDIAESAPVLVQPVAAVEEPVMQESTSDHDDLDEASASVYEPPILTATNNASEVSAASSELVSEETIETVEEPVISDIPAVSQEPVVVEYSSEEVSAESTPALEEPQGLEEPVVAKDATEIEATEVVEAPPESIFVAEDTVDDIIAQPIDEAGAVLEDSIDTSTSKAINDELVESAPVQDEYGTNIVEEPIVADEAVASSLTGLTPVQDTEESTLANNTEEPTTTVHEHITDVPAHSTHRKYFGLLSSSRLLNMVS